MGPLDTEQTPKTCIMKQSDIDHYYSNQVNQNQYTTESRLSSTLNKNETVMNRLTNFDVNSLNDSEK